MATKKATETKSSAKKAAAKKTSAKKTEMPVDGNMGDTHEKVQLWKNGPYWATSNIGAEKPEDFGYYFWWGDTVGYKRVKNKWVATDGSSSDFSFVEINTPSFLFPDMGKRGEWITDDRILVSEHDVAHVQWGGGWRMPTKKELQNLVDKCDWTWKKVNGVEGYVVSGKGAYASVSIFLPAAGRGEETSLSAVGSYGQYWSSVPYRDGYYSWGLGFHSGIHGTSSYFYIYYGMSVRPVQSRSPNSERG